jgi:hypothetical protein
VHARAVRGGKPYVGGGRLEPGDLGAPALGDRLAVEDQRVLREVDDERQADCDGERHLEDRADQVL